MYTSRDNDYLMEIRRTNPEIYEFIQRITTEFQYEIRLGCHDICNIISLIFGNFQLIELINPELKQNPRWNQMDEDIRYLVKTMEAISIYRYSNKIQPVSTDVRTFLDTFSETILNNTVYASLHFNLIVDSELPEILLDTSKITYIMESLLNNIVDNALPADVTIRARCDQSDLLIEISDNISKIAPEIKESLFHPFTTNKQYHPGLSLASSYRIMMAHGGALEYKPNSSGDCCFLLRFKNII